MILLFGHSGLLGNYVYHYLSSKHYTIIHVNRKNYDILQDSVEKLETIITNYRPTCIINCTNSFKDTLEVQLKINSLFPYHLSKLATKHNSNLIHISTNGVFLGTTNGSYLEQDIPNAIDSYGITKLLGENIPHTVIRTSILGETNRSDSYFIEWLKKSESVNGFTNHYWNGVTCLYLCQLIVHIIETNSYWKGVRHICSDKIYSKYDLAQFIKNIYYLSTSIEKQESNYKNLSLKTSYEITFRKPNLEMDLIEQKLFTHLLTKEKGSYTTKYHCRFCNTPTTDIFHLGDQFGLAGGFLKELSEPDKLYPLTLSLCNHCKYIQCKQVVTADELFKKNYFYYSSMIPSLVKHFESLSSWIEQRFDKNTKIIEMGCNDGVLLHPLYEKGFHHLIGVDPSQTIRNIKQPIITYPDYFDSKTVDDIIDNYGYQDLFISCNSFAHIDNMQDILYNMKRVLHPKHGKAIIEVHYSKHIFDSKQFDFIYHEHMGYYTVTSLYNICKLNNMTLSYVEQVPNHGGSIRCIIDMHPTHETLETIQDFITMEQFMFEETFFKTYQETLYEWKYNFKNKINQLIIDGKKVYGYGASGRANTLLHFAELNLEYIIDDAPSKIGSYTPVYNIPIVNSSILYGNNKPDYIVILAWTYADYIMKLHKEFKGKFIIPLPDIKDV